MKPTERNIDVTGPMAIGVCAVLVLIVAIGGWSVLTRISGAVVARGEVRIEAPTRVISHERGGIVAQAPVRNGDTVKAGDILLVLEDTVLTTKLSGVQDHLFEMLAEEARWRAQAADASELVVGDRLAAFVAEFPSISRRLARHREHLLLDQRALEQSSSQQARIISQIEQQIAGERIKLASLEAEAAVIAAELENAQGLLSRGLDKFSNVSRLERDRALKSGEIGVVRASIAEKGQRVLELELGIRKMQESHRGTALERISRIEKEKTKLFVERAELLEQLLKRQVRAPVDGVIHDSQLSGPGTLVAAGKPVLSIVPATEAIMARVRVRSEDIDQVHVGQMAAIRLNSYNTRSTPLFGGRVNRIGADTVADAASKRQMYEVQILLDVDEVTASGEYELVNGMPISAFLTTGEQTPLQYLTQPVTDFFALSFRDT